MTYWKTREFKNLQQAWYQRLEAEGFQDAEELVGNEMRIKERSTSAMRDRAIETPANCMRFHTRRNSQCVDECDATSEGPLQSARLKRRALQKIFCDAKEAYYTAIGQKLAETIFRNSVDRFILTRHAEGKKAFEIVEELKARGTPRFRHSVRFIVRRYEMLWGLRKYDPRQLGKKVS